MNVIVACWDTLFKCPRVSALPRAFKEQKAWRDAFATCRHVQVALLGDGVVGYVRLAAKRRVTVPAKSEVFVWGHTKGGQHGADYCALLEPMPDASVGDVGIAKALVTVKRGRVPVRVCNPHPYSVSIGRFQKLGRLCTIEDSDVHGSNDLVLAMEEDGVVQVALVDSTAAVPNVELPSEVGKLGERPDLSKQQEGELLYAPCFRSGKRCSRSTMRILGEQTWSNIRSLREMLPQLGRGTAQFHPCCIRK